MTRIQIITCFASTLLIPDLIFAQAREPQPGIEDLQDTFKVSKREPLQLRVEVDAGEVRVSKGSSTDEVRVGLRYDKTLYHHTFRFNESRNTLEIAFERQKWFDREGDQEAAELELELPTEAELHLECKIKAGKIDMQLGGLKIADMALETMAGEVNLDFKEPNRIEMSNLDLNTKVGESKFIRLGNARFRDADINGGIGEMTIDFTGEMAKDAVARVDLDIGETAIILPREAGTKLSVSKFLFLSHLDLPYELRQDGRYYFTENYDRADHTFQLRVSSGLGECRVELR
ncbi:MAG: hypothetical protein ACREOO_15010 [bacterium]